MPTQRCLLRGGSLDGQLRLVAAGPNPTLTVQHELDGRWWAETYAHDGANAVVPVFGSVRDLVFRERRPNGSDGDPNPEARRLRAHTAEQGRILPRQQPGAGQRAVPPRLVKDLRCR